MRTGKEYPKIKAVDFFSGCGGTSWGLAEAGIQVVGAVDNDPDAAETYRRNFPNAAFIEKDIADVTVDEVADLMSSDSFTLLTGCAPCQPFSAQQKHSDASDPRRSLLLSFMHFVEALLPDFILVENVPGLQKLSKEDGPLPIFLDRIRQLGYQFDVGVLRAADFGVPQIRRRLILMASRFSDVELPERTHGDGLKPYSSVRDWIGDLPSLLAGEQDPNDNEHRAARLSTLNLERIRATPEGGGRLDWPEELWANCHLKYKGHTDAYGRLTWDKPASGLTTRCISYSNGRFGHPEQDRALSVREAALLQTFPRNYEFFGTPTSTARQVGNAVPPLMAEALGHKLIELAGSGLNSDV